MTPRACAVCGKEYTPKAKVQKYCGPSCYATIDKARQRTAKSATRATEPKAERPTKPCAICANQFTPKSRSQRLCSPECRKTWAYKCQYGTVRCKFAFNGRAFRSDVGEAVRDAAGALDSLLERGLE
jgi:predicted nucleic acid-binding Zn ribbon protein